MRITSTNFFDTTPNGIFYKATQSGVQKCFTVDNATARNHDDSAEATWGYVADSLFVSLNRFTDLLHFDQPQNGFFDNEEEATAFHRELVLNYIRGLNASSLKSHPIEAA